MKEDAQNTQNSQKIDFSRIGVLNGLRGIAILLVIFCHYGKFFDNSRQRQEWNLEVLASGTLLQRIFALFEATGLTFLTNGFIGANLFFVLSGFVLYLPFALGKNTIPPVFSFTHRFVLSERPVKPSFFEFLHAIWLFYKNRVQRLMPLYAFCILIYVMLPSNLQTCFPQNDGSTMLCQVYAKDYTHWQNFRSLVLALTFTGFMFGEYLPSMYHPFWSLAFEWWFSILVPLLIAVLQEIAALLTVTLLHFGARNEKIQQYQKQPKSLFMVCQAFVLCSGMLVYLCFCTLLRIRVLDWINGKSPQPLVGTFGEEFGLGMVLAFFYVWLVIPWMERVRGVGGDQAKPPQAQPQQQPQQDTADDTHGTTEHEDTDDEVDSPIRIVKRGQAPKSPLPEEDSLLLQQQSAAAAPYMALPASRKTSLRSKIVNMFFSDQTLPMTMFSSGISVLSLAFMASDIIEKEPRGMADLLQWLRTPWIRASGNVFLQIGFSLVILGAVMFDRPFKPILRQLLDCLRSQVSFVTKAQLIAERIAYYALANPLLQLIGMMCFSLYAWHYWFQLIVVQQKDGYDLPHVLYFSGILFAVSCLSYSYIEFPKRSAKQLFLQYPKSIENTDLRASWHAPCYVRFE